MVIVGEKLNSSVPSAMAAFSAHNADAVLAIASAQTQSGADYLDINTAMTSNEKEDLLWAARIITQAIDIPLMIDTPSAEAAAYVYENVELKNSIVNSVTLDAERFDGMMEIVRKYDTGVVALPAGPAGLPKGAAERVDVSRTLVERIAEQGVPHDRIYVDLLIEAAGADYEAPSASIEAARTLRAEYPDLHLIAGLSNVSFGLPDRAALNSAFLCCLMTAGADVFIMDPTRKQTMLAYRACDLLLGRDEYCIEYITYCRSIAEG